MAEVKRRCLICGNKFLTKFKYRRTVRYCSSLCLKKAIKRIIYERIKEDFEGYRFCETPKLKYRMKKLKLANDERVRDKIIKYYSSFVKSGIAQNGSDAFDFFKDNLQIQIIVGNCSMEMNVKIPLADLSIMRLNECFDLLKY